MLTYLHVYTTAYTHRFKNILRGAEGGTKQVSYLQVIY